MDIIKIKIECINIDEKKNLIFFPYTFYYYNKNWKRKIALNKILNKKSIKKDFNYLDENKIIAIETTLSIFVRNKYISIFSKNINNLEIVNNVDLISIKVAKFNSFKNKKIKISYIKFKKIN